MMRKNGAEAAAYMAGLAKQQASGVKNWCLRTCRLAWGLPPDEESAIKEWESIPDKFKHTDPLTAPVGAPHFWKVGKFGHIALQAEHEGFVWSTDAPVTDKVGLVAIPWFAKKWRAVYLGWAEQLNNKELPLGVEAPKKKAARPKKAAARKATK